MKNITMILGILFIVIAGAAIVYSNSDSAPTGIDTGDSVSGEVQKVVLSMKDYNYYPNKVRVKANQPVEISLDDSVRGCYRSFTIPDFKLSKYLAKPSDKLTFTPTEKGSYRFACSMGMGYGTLIVE